jgi:hypothetical protein
MSFFAKLHVDFGPWRAYMCRAGLRNFLSPRPGRKVSGNNSVDHSSAGAEATDVISFGSTAY